ncbi:hypothetical protein HNQ80_002904 [Anaerosolibacter carboniphilus]|uniref:DUF3787 domain-containing protein n=1 Tax=Anaerosolibacter carboniphilus TaxID=1417629 RepID=A0A841KXT1_9FIRM|nr:DUF3787 domain-containing protein [Anaerosolibacter carboniphilus]MBB6216800.1 hypothetical protein [Anaerosolibacter carboniphilus]
MANPKVERTNLGMDSTAAWADIDHVLSDTGVPIPSETAVTEAKEWVEENQK